MANETKKYLDLAGLTRYDGKLKAFVAATYVPLTQKAAANGVATLDANGLVPSSQLPSYVDDVLSFANLEAFPAEGETGKIYLAEDTGKLYRWAPASGGESGQYVNVSSAVGVADEAIKLQTARKINGVDFDGTADITINAVDATPRIPESDKAVANGVATLDANVKVPVAQLPLATTTTAGAVIVGTNVDVTAGTISVATATGAVKGVVQVGTNIDVAEGVISVKTGSTTDLGLVKVGDNIDVTAGTISVKTGSATDLGVLKVGTNLDVAAGVVSVKTGSATDKGVLQVGDNINVANGVISLDKASTSAFGIAKVGTNIDVAEGVISVKTGSASDLGLVKVGTNIDVTEGTISVKTGSTTDKGVLQVGSNITVAEGVISLTAANVNNALGYELAEITNAEVDALFD